MDNNNRKITTEKFYYPSKKLWKENEPNEEKYKKSLTYLIDKLSSSKNQNQSSLLFRLINFIFFNKIK